MAASSSSTAMKAQLDASNNSDGGSSSPTHPPAPNNALVTWRRMESARQDNDRRMKWKEVRCTGQIPTGRIGHTVTTNGTGLVYLWGGVNETMERESKYLDDFYRYNFAKKEWTEVPLTVDKPLGRAFHTAVMHNGQMVVFGGCNGRGRFNQVYSINGETGECRAILSTESEAPSTRYCHTAVVHDDKMVVFGGKCGGRNSNKRLADMYGFDLNTHEWSVIEATGSLPCSRSAHICVVYMGKMLMFGGRNAEGRCCEDLYEFTFATREWRRIDRSGPIWSTVFVRARHSAVIHNDKLITFAGWNGKKKLNDLLQYNLDSQSCSVMHDSDENDSSLPCRRECHSAVMVGNTMVVFGGRFRGLFMNDNYEYELDPISLKEFCRSFIAEHSAHIDYSNQPKYGLPISLISFIQTYEHRHLSYADRQKALEAEQRRCKAMILQQAQQQILQQQVAAQAQAVASLFSPAAHMLLQPAGGSPPPAQLPQQPSQQQPPQQQPQQPTSSSFPFGFALQHPFFEAFGKRF